MSLLRPTLSRMAALLALLLATGSYAAETLPAELRPFVQKGYSVLSLDEVDLNRDGRKETVLVIEADDTTNDEGPRSLLLFSRTPAGKLTLASRNDKAILCRRCGGIFGDPYEGMDFQAGGFTLLHYGGSNWRWRLDIRFAWSRRDQTWQLVEVDTESFHTSDPDNGKSRRYRPPRDFGLINLAGFDYENWEGRGKR